MIYQLTLLFVLFSHLLLLLPTFLISYFYTGGNVSRTACNAADPFSSSSRPEDKGADAFEAS
jgi:hypothetical protein